MPDPLLRVVTLLDGVVKTKEYYLIKYGISHVLTKDFYLTDVDPPIAVLAADK